MKKYRYLVASAVSLLIHGVALSFSAPKQEISLASNNEGHAVSIQFVSLAQPEKQAEKKEVEPKPIPPQPAAPKEPTPEKPKLKKETPKPVTKPKKVVKKKSTPATPIEPRPAKTAVGEPEKPIEPTPKEAPVEDKAETETETPQTASTNAATASKPKMVEKPTFSAKPTPVSYPRLAQKRGWQGSTLVEIWIDEDGEQIKQTVVNSSGHKLLDEAALNAVSEWQFQHRNEQGQRIAYRVQVPINFQLN
ncbi:TonB family protein [Vibrio breoganii]